MSNDPARSHDPARLVALYRWPLRGQDPQVLVHTPSPGTLNLSHGRHTAHRVTTGSGPQPRSMAVLTYYERPGAWFTPEEQLGFSGRVVQP